MRNNPDVYLLYEYMKKLLFTVRIKVQLDEKVPYSVSECKTRYLPLIELPK